MHLTESIHIRGRQFKNRTVMAPMVPNTAGPDGAVTPEYSDFYEARAQAGVGYIVLGGAYVHPDGRGFGHQLGIDDDRLIPGLRELVARLKTHSRVGIQLSFKSIGRLPETFSRSEIDTYRKAFASAARRARDAGVDAIELHAAMTTGSISSCLRILIIDMTNTAARRSVACGCFTKRRRRSGTQSVRTCCLAFA